MQQTFAILNFLQRSGQWTSFNEIARNFKLQDLYQLRLIMDKLVENKRVMFNSDFNSYKALR